MEVLSVASELYPIIKTGGLADVAGALPYALAKNGAKMRTLLPAYNYEKSKFSNHEIIHTYKDLFGTKAQLISCNHNDLELILLDAPSLYNRVGGPYLDKNGKDYPDNWKRFAALSKAAADIAGGICTNYKPDIVHAHDWQAALAPVYMKHGNKRAKSTPSLITIHNIAFQGKFDAEVFTKLGLGKGDENFDNFEFYGDISFLKAGLIHSNFITTVSPQYAREILTEDFGMGLDGVIRENSHKLSGILNGIDIEVWNPKTDEALAKNYDIKNITHRKHNKSKIEEIFELDRNNGPILCVISRLTEQKGIDVLINLFGAIVDLGARLVILGSGDKEVEATVKDAANKYKGRIGVKIGYDEALSHLLQGGSDAILIPSRFEPCGLTQLYGLRYGCVPIVARNGGLADTIIDANDAAINAGVATGFQFAKVNEHEFYYALKRAIDLYKTPKDWHKIQSNGMKADVSWVKSGAAYFELYKCALAEK